MEINANRSIYKLICVATIEIALHETEHDMKQFFLRSKDKCKMLTKMLTLSKLQQIETSSLAGTRVQVMSNRKQA